MKPTKLEVIEFLQNAALCGMNRDRCAEYFGIHAQTLQKYLAEDDVDFSFLLLAERRDRAQRAGSLEEAALSLGMTVQSVNRLIKRHSV